MMPKIEQQVNCHSCLWNKMCVEPPAMTTEEIKNLIEKENNPTDSKDSKIFGSLLTALVFTGKDKQGTLCPVFADKLRESSELTTKIKEIMKSF